MGPHVSARDQRDSGERSTVAMPIAFESNDNVSPSPVPALLNNTRISHRGHENGACVQDCRSKVRSQLRTALRNGTIVPACNLLARYLTTKHNLLLGNVRVRHERRIFFQTIGGLEVLAARRGETWSQRRRLARFTVSMPLAVCSVGHVSAEPDTHR